MLELFKLIYQIRKEETANKTQTRKPETNENKKKGK